MAIIIPHRFIDRLLPHENVNHISTIVIGTFNPGKPVLENLTKEELQLYLQKANSKKYQRFELVKNFYDRPQNRFWKIMDTIENVDFYKNKPLKTPNPNGLKFYSKMKNRDLVFENQKAFCERNGLFITDIVRQIQPSSFENIYDNFPDKGIENADCQWNTKQIIEIAEKYNPKKILFNFNVNKSIPKISEQLTEIKDSFPNKIHQILSTSGAAGNNYETLCESWHPHIK
jgi:hypothetical protein